MHYGILVMPGYLPPFLPFFFFLDLDSPDSAAEPDSSSPLPASPSSGAGSVELSVASGAGLFSSSAFTAAAGSAGVSLEGAVSWVALLAGAASMGVVSAAGASVTGAEAAGASVTGAEAAGASSSLATGVSSGLSEAGCVSSGFGSTGAAVGLAAVFFPKRLEKNPPAGCIYRKSTINEKRCQQTLAAGSGVVGEAIGATVAAGAAAAAGVVGVGLATVFFFLEGWGQ